MLKRFLVLMFLLVLCSCTNVSRIRSGKNTNINITTSPHAQLALPVAISQGGSSSSKTDPVLQLKDVNTDIISKLQKKAESSGKSIDDYINSILVTEANK